MKLVFECEKKEEEEEADIMRLCQNVQKFDGLYRK